MCITELTELKKEVFARLFAFVDSIAAARDFEKALSFFAWRRVKSSGAKLEENAAI